MRRFTARELTGSAVLAAVYIALTVAVPIPQFGGVQFRPAEALTVLPFLFPAATPGITVGCVLANLTSPYPLDAVFGGGATLLACLLTQHAPNRFLAVLPPVICNMAVVGAEVAWFTAGPGPAFWPAFALNAATVGVGEALSCGLLGSVLLSAMPKFFRDRIPADRLSRLEKSGR